MVRLHCAYPQSKIDLGLEGRALWYDSLKDLDSVDFNNAVDEIILTEKFFPAISTIRELARKHESAVDFYDGNDIAAELTPKQITNNRVRIKELLDGLCGKGD